MANKTISELTPVSTVTGDLEVMLDTRNGLKKTTLATLKNYIKTPNNEDKTITVNGTYTAGAGYDGLGEVTVNVPGSANLQEVKYITTNGIHEADKQEVILAKGMYLNDNEKSYYTGSEPLIGDYLWFQTDDITTLKINDPVYNGKTENDIIIPNFEQALGIITNKRSFKNISVDFDDRETWYVYENDIGFVEYEGEIYAKLGIHTKEYATVDIVGNYIWIKGNYTNLNVNSLCYNSTDTTDTVPDLSSSIGHVTNASMLTDMQFDFMNSSYQIVLEYHRIQNYSVYNTIYDGMQKVNVSVPTFEEAKEERNALIRTNLSGAYTIPDEITHVGSYAFANEQQLTSVNLNNTLTLGDHCFYNCKNLETVILNPYISEIPYAAFNSCTALLNIDTSHIKYLGDESFQYCTSLETIDISSVIGFYGYSFYECTNLKDITMPDANGYTISNYTFFNCTSLKNIDLKQVRWIHDNAFRNCTSLEYVKIGTAIDSINSNAFYGCTQSNLVIEFGLTESEFNNKSDLVSYKPWGATNATILYADSNAHTFQVNCSNEDITPDIELEINGKILNTNKTKQPNNTEITYTVSCRNYITQTNTITLTEDTVIDVTLVADPNPKYYEIDTNSVSWDGSNISVIQNEYTDDSILRISDLNGLENITINDLEWNNYFGNIGTTSDEFIFTFKINSQEDIVHFDGMSLSTATGDDGFVLYLNKNSNNRGYYSYLRINSNDVSEDWRNNGTICPINETIQMRMRYTDHWEYDMNGYNTWTSWNSATIDPLTNIFSIIYSRTLNNTTIDIDFMNTGFKKNNSWIKRLITERLPKSDLIINTTPSNANIIVNGKNYTSGQNIKLPTGSVVNYSISAEDYVTQSNTFTLNENTTLNITLVADPTIYEIDTTKITLTQNKQDYPYALRIDNDALSNDVLVNVINPSLGDNPYNIQLNNEGGTLLNALVNGDTSEVDSFEMHYIVNNYLTDNNVDIDNVYINSFGLLGSEYNYQKVTEPHEHKDIFHIYHRFRRDNTGLVSQNNSSIECMGVYNRDTQWTTTGGINGSNYNLPSYMITDGTLKLSIIDNSLHMDLIDNIHKQTYSGTLSISSSLRSTYEIIPEFLNNNGWNVFGWNDISLDLKHTGFKKNGSWVWRPIKLQSNHNTLIINSTPSTAKVIVNGGIYSSGQSINLPTNTEITWRVELENYTTQIGTLTLTENTTLNITLDSVAWEWDNTKLTLQNADGATYELVTDTRNDKVLLNLYGTNTYYPGDTSTNNGTPFIITANTDNLFYLDNLFNSAVDWTSYTTSHVPFVFEMKFKILNLDTLPKGYFIPILGRPDNYNNDVNWDSANPLYTHNDCIQVTPTDSGLDFGCQTYYKEDESTYKNESFGSMYNIPDNNNEFIFRLESNAMSITTSSGNIYKTGIQSSREKWPLFNWSHSFVNELFTYHLPIAHEGAANIQIDLKNTGFKDWQGNWIWRPIKVMTPQTNNQELDSSEAQNEQDIIHGSEESSGDLD